MKFTLISAMFLYLLIYFGGHMRVSAQSAGNSNTIIELYETTPSPIPQKPVVTPTATKKSSVPVPFTQTGLSFSQPYLSFGFLLPGEPLLRTDTIQIKTSYKLGVTLFVVQNHALQANNQLIPNTTCDGGSCSPSNAGVWLSPLTFGYGFRCENSALCAYDFAQADTYRPFSNTQSASVLTAKDTIESATLVYKLNIPGTQQPLPYSNSITYFLIPNL